MTTRNEALCDEIAKRLDEFEALVEDEEGREGYHTPTEMERYYIDSFVAELVGDRDFLRLCIQARIETEEYHLAQGGCPECGKVNDGVEAHWGPCDGQRLLDFLPK